jgi:hypothetical protein
VGAGDEHHKAPQKTIIIKNKKKLQPPTLDPNPARTNQTKENTKHETGEKAQTGLTSPPGAQSINLSQTNRTSNPLTNEPTRTTKPVNHICISNDYETAVEAQKEPETYDDHATTNKKTFLLANCKQGIQNETMAWKLTLKQGNVETQVESRTKQQQETTDEPTKKKYFPNQ